MAANLEDEEVKNKPRQTTPFEIKGTQKERANFLKACRVFFENFRQALIAECKKESKEYPTSFSTKDWTKLDFSGLANALVGSKRVESSRASAKNHHGASAKNHHGGSYYTFGFSATSVPVPNENNRVYLNVSSGSKFESHDKLACILGTVSPIERVADNKYKFHQSLPKNEGPMFNVFFQTPKCQSIYKVKQLRNFKIGHCMKVAITDEDMKQIFESVREAYRQMSTSEVIIAELEQIEQESDYDENDIKKYQAEIEKAQALYAEIHERFMSLEDHVEKTAERQCQFETEVSASFSKLDEEVSEIRGAVQQLQISKKSDTNTKKDIQPQHQTKNGELLKDTDDPELEKKYQEVINTEMVSFKRFTDMASLSPYLIQHKLLTGDELAQLNSLMYNPTQQSMLFYTQILPKKGSKAYRIFYKCLTEAVEDPSGNVGHKDLLEYFNRSVNLQ